MPATALPIVVTPILVVGELIVVLTPAVTFTVNDEVIDNEPAEAVIARLPDPTVADIFPVATDIVIFPVATDISILPVTTESEIPVPATTLRVIEPERTVFESTPVTVVLVQPKA